MPRGKRIVFTVSCTGPDGSRIGTIRLHRQDKKGVGWKEYQSKLEKYCPICMKRMPVKLKEERHSK